MNFFCKYQLFFLNYYVIISIEASIRIRGMKGMKE